MLTSCKTLIEVRLKTAMLEIYALSFSYFPRRQMILWQRKSRGGGLVVKGGKVVSYVLGRKHLNTISYPKERLSWIIKRKVYIKLLSTGPGTWCLTNVILLPSFLPSINGFLDNPQEDSESSPLHNLLCLCSFNKAQ